MRYFRKIDRKVSHGLAVYTGKIHKKPVVYIATGIGKTNASHATTILIERLSPKMIVNFGVGGAYPSSGLKTGDIAIAEKEIYGDEGVFLKDGFEGVKLIGIPFLKKGRKKYFNEFPLDNMLTKKAVEFSKLVTRPPQADSSLVTKIKSGFFLTLSACTGTYKRAVELEKRFHAICENMEGAAVAHICILYRIPMIEIRGISNTIEDRDTKNWNIKLAAENCQKFVIEFLRRL